jgi:outer membrane protein TolC
MTESIRLSLMTLLTFALSMQAGVGEIRADSTKIPASAAVVDLGKTGHVDPWWNADSQKSILQEPQWVAFDLNTVMIDALQHSPRIGAVKHRTSVAMERIIQEDAAFDAKVLLDSRYGRTSDPVGNTLTTGGPSRLSEESWSNRAGIGRTARDGTKIELSQQAGLLDSNSLFFDPSNQGNTRLNLGLTRPLRAGSGQLYNERLLLQAKIDSKVSWHEMLKEVQGQVAGVMTGFWRLYEARCHLLQRRHALNRGLEIAALIEGRRAFDSGGLETAKVDSRLARRRDAVVESERNVFNQQIFLTQLVGSPSLPQGAKIELIPNGLPVCPPLVIDPKDAILTGLNHRYDVYVATLDVERAGLAISISRNELLPQLDAVVGGYLAGLNGRNDVMQSFADQFARTPGFSGGLVYERPYGNRAAKSRLRSAHQRYLEMGDRYREIVSLTAAEVDLAVRQLNTISTQLQTKAEVLDAVTRQEMMVRQRWETMGTEGRYAALVLEDVLEQQEARTAAEIEYVSTHVAYLLALIELQRSMGTLLQAEGIEPIGGEHCSGEIMFPLNTGTGPGAAAETGRTVAMRSQSGTTAAAPAEQEVVESRLAEPRAAAAQVTRLPLPPAPAESDRSNKPTRLGRGDG